MPLSYHFGAPILVQDNSGIYGASVQVSLNSLATSLTINIVWSDDGPGGSFPPIGTQQIAYSDVPLEVSYLQLSTGAFQCKIATNYTAQPSFVGQLYRNVLELWTVDGTTKLKGPASGSLAETALAQGFDEWKTNPATIPVPNGNLQQYLMKVWSKNETTQVQNSNQLQYILTQGQATGTQVNPQSGPWDVSYEIKKGTSVILPAQTTAGLTTKSFTVSRDNPMTVAASDYIIVVSVKRSTETGAETFNIPVTVVETDPGGTNLSTAIVNSVDGLPIAPGGTAQVLVNQALMFKAINGKPSYSYNFRYGSIFQGTLVTDAAGNGQKVFTFNAPGNYDVNIQDPLTGSTSGWALTATTVVDPPDDPPQCPTGYHWDQTLSVCVADTTTPPAGGGKTFLEQLTALFSNAPVIVGAIAIALALRKGGGGGRK